MLTENGWKDEPREEMAKRITQSEIARAAGVSPSTVSLSLSNSPSVNSETREHVLKICEELGYVPDPWLASLAFHSSLGKKSVFRGTLAWLVRGEAGYDWRKNRMYAGYYEGACEAAKSRGYNLEIFDFSKFGMNPERLAKILRSRNIVGILLCPQPNADAILDFPWGYFSAVTFGYTLASPVLHSVTDAQHRAMIEVMRRLRERGYKRIAFALGEKMDNRVLHHYLAAYLLEQYAAGQEPIVCGDNKSKERLQKWIEAQVPDAILVGEYAFRRVLEMGFDIPRSLGVACPALSDRLGRESGIFVDPMRVGEVALELLVELMSEGQRGEPKVQRRLHVDGVWRQGETVRQVLNSKANDVRCDRENQTNATCL